MSTRCVLVQNLCERSKDGRRERELDCCDCRRPPIFSGGVGHGIGSESFPGLTERRVVKGYVSVSPVDSGLTLPSSRSPPRPRPVASGYPPRTYTGRSEPSGTRD